jgi:hypothetical protein
MDLLVWEKRESRGVIYYLVLYTYLWMNMQIGMTRLIMDSYASFKMNLVKVF